MRRAIRETSWPRGLFALSLLLALAVRMAIPAGFMPVQGARGIVIGLCTGHGPAQLAVPIERKGEPAGHAGMADGLCAFAAGLSGGLLGPAPVALPLVEPVFGFGMARAIADLTVHRLAAPPPPALGPPGTH